MTAKSRRGVFAVLAAVGILGVLAIAASSAAAQSGSVPSDVRSFRAFVDNGFSTALNGVGGANIVFQCSGGDGFLALQGTQSNGIAKANYADEGANNTVNGVNVGSLNNDSVQAQDDDFDTGNIMALNDGQINDEVTGHAEFVNGNTNRTMSVLYQTEDEPGPLGNTNADCMAQGSVIKGNTF